MLIPSAQHRELKRLLETLRREALAFCFFSLASTSWGANPQVHRIRIDKLAFGPAPDGLHVDDIVEWTNSDILRHTATATDGSFDIDLPAGATAGRILKRVGGVTYDAVSIPE